MTTCDATCNTCGNGVRNLELVSGEMNNIFCNRCGTHLGTVDLTSGIAVNSTGGSLSTRTRGDVVGGVSVQSINIGDVAGGDIIKANIQGTGNSINIETILRALGKRK